MCKVVAIEQRKGTHFLDKEEKDVYENVKKIVLLLDLEVR